MSLHPILKWAQRKDKIFITLPLRDIKNQRVTLKHNKFAFQCQSHSNKYQFNFDFYQEIQEEKSQWTKTGFHIVFVICKKNSSNGYWARLTKQNKKNQYIQCDWDKWIDEDEQKQEGNKGLGDVDYGNMNNFNDSDDQEQPVDKKLQNINDLQKQEEI